MLVLDAAMFVPAVFGMAMAAFLWDDPHPDGLGLRALATLVLLATPFCIAANVALSLTGLARGRGPAALHWITFLPCCGVLGVLAFFKWQDLGEARTVRGFERSYAEIVAPAQMAPFRRLTADLPAWVRCSLARRAQRELAEHGVPPPATVDALYADQYRTMLGHQEAYRAGKLSRADYQDQTRSDWAQYESISEKYGETAAYPRDKFLAVSQE